MKTEFSADAHPISASERGTHLHASNILRRMFKPAARRVGVEWASFHTLRHTCGTLLARKGLRPEEIQGWLGHHAASFTQDTYLGRPSRLPDVDALGFDPLEEVVTG